MHIEIVPVGDFRSVDFWIGNIEDCKPVLVYLKMMPDEIRKGKQIIFSFGDKEMDKLADILLNANL